MANGLSQYPCGLFGRLQPIWYGFGSLLLVLASSTHAREFYFAPSTLEGVGLSQQNIDLSLFSKENGQLPGVYKTNVRLNKQTLDDESIGYVNDEKGELHPLLTPQLLRKWGIRVDAYPELAKQPANNPLSDPLGHYIPFATARFDFNSMTLHISMPQAAIDAHSRNFIDPSRWNDGVPVLFADYSFSGSQRENGDHNNDSSQYLNLRSGANLGGWRLRSYSVWNKTAETQSWDTINTWIQHDIDFLKAQLTAGENSTRGEVFDSIQYNGVNITSDEQMLPYSQRGFAPVIRGIAHSNAEVTIRQNGYIIYQATVAPGAFEITDIYSTTNSADLDITIKEADGTEFHSVQPFSSVAVMQRPGNLRYEATLARYRADNNQQANEPLFAQGSAIFGLNNYLTLFGGITSSSNYQSVDIGIGMALGEIGALSTDITAARAHLDNGEQYDGQSLRAMYTKNIEATDTNLTLASYRYSTSGYYSFADANQKYDPDDDWSYEYNKRSRLQASINQTLLGSSLYLTGYQQDYWNTNRKETSISSGINSVISGISYHLAYTYSKTDEEQSDQSMSFGFSIPLSRWLPKSWANYNVSNSKNGYTNQDIGLGGTLFQDDRMSYSLQQSMANHDGEDSSSLYGTYRSQYANLNAGYYSSSDGSKQITYGMSGGVVAHPAGVTLSQPLGDQFAIVTAKGASGIHFSNQRGVQTDIFGNAVIPSLSPYQENVIRIDTTSLPNDVDTDETAMTVIPSRNAAVSTHFSAHVGYRVLITLTRPNGQKVPFGAMGTVDSTAISGIVNDEGVLYLAGVSENIPLTVKWGNSATQRCNAVVTLSPSTESLAAGGIRQATALCNPEINYAK